MDQQSNQGISRSINGVIRAVNEKMVELTNGMKFANPILFNLRKFNPQFFVNQEGFDHFYIYRDEQVDAHDHEEVSFVMSESEANGSASRHTTAAEVQAPFQEVPESCSGFLTKAPAVGTFGSRKTRYFQLNDGVLKYFVEENCKVQKGKSINLMDFKLRPKPNNKTGFLLEPRQGSSGKRTFDLTAANIHEFDKWINVLKNSKYCDSSGFK